MREALLQEHFAKSQDQANGDKTDLYALDNKKKNDVGSENNLIDFTSRLQELINDCNFNQNDLLNFNVDSSLQASFCNTFEETDTDVNIDLEDDIKELINECNFNEDDCINENVDFDIDSIFNTEP